jgi:hypothetical protein
VIVYVKTVVPLRFRAYNVQDIYKFVIISSDEKSISGILFQSVQRHDPRLAHL